MTAYSFHPCPFNPKPAAMTQDQSALSRDQQLANELEEMRIDMLIDVGLCVDERYLDYCGNIVNQQFRDLARRMGLPKHTSTTAAAFAKYLPPPPTPEDEDPD